VATIRQRESGSWEVVIRRKGILKRVHYASADTEADAVAYARRIEGQLDQVIMPVELLDSSPPSAETALDWCLRNEWLNINPLRMLPQRYASYTPADGEKRLDVERDRRLLPGEYERILWILEGHFPPDKQRGIAMVDRLAMRLLFTLAIETAMRLREMYTLTVQQVDLSKKTVFLDKTKNGDKRQVPMSSVALTAMSE
jgi:integrase